MKMSLVVLVCAAAAGVLLAGCSDETAGDEQTLTYTEGRGDFTPIGDVTREKTPAGSGFALSIPLEDDSGSTAGTLYAVCIATQESSGENLMGTCTGTADLSAGALALNVGGEIGESVTGSVIGGTEDYDGATGSFESSGGNHATDTFTFTLP